ncbi:MAG: hypothetical protein U0T78_07595 [Cloacibacterium normanense]
MQWEFSEIQKDEHHREKFIFEVKIPMALSYLAFLQGDAFVPGINDLVHGK